ncbi:VRR-NUC domain-containing protein [Vibrio sp. S4M6]|nr:VRR-NUC domain-containing protein [Vibrio sinus]MCL9779900.1 VRR-NUC domain-containing protein [Vibrio sinus]
MPDPIALPQRYYLANFKKLCEHANTQYADLLNEQEAAWLKSFATLDVESQCLLVRLLTRKGGWFRSDKLVYSEIPHIEDALNTLQNVQFIQINPSISNQHLAQHLLTKPEIIKVFDLGVGAKAMRKQELVELLEDTPFRAFKRLTFQVIQLVNEMILAVLQVLFFANTYQDLSQFVLQDLGLNRFEHYSLSKVTRFFRTREEINHLISIDKIRKSYVELDRASQAAQLDDHLNRIPANCGNDYVDEKRQKLINHLARDLERQKSVTQAIEWFAKTTLPPSRERRARMYHTLGEYTLEKKLINDMLLSPIDINEKEVALRLEHKRLRREGQSIISRQPLDVKEFTVDLDLTQTKVEIAVQHHLQDLGWRVYYAENSFLNGLFGLAFWPAIFASIDGAFINAFQRMPKDMFSPLFIEKRRSIIESIFDELKAHGLSSLMATFNEKQGIENPFVYWPTMTKSLLEQAISIIPLKHVMVLFDILLSDLRNMKTGMPDLIAFKENEYWWVEVKGPGDKLQDNQKRWLHHFNRHQIPYSVCYVNHNK